MTAHRTHAADSTAYDDARYDTRETPAVLGPNRRRDRGAPAQRTRRDGSTFGVQLATARDTLERPEIRARDSVPSANEPPPGCQRGSMGRRNIEPGGRMRRGVT